MSKCPFCGSENTRCLSLRDGIHENYKKVTKNCTQTGTHFFPISEELCLECGYVFKKMSDENLKKYHEEKEYFTH